MRMSSSNKSAVVVIFLIMFASAQSIANVGLSLNISVVMELPKQDVALYAARIVASLIPVARFTLSGVGRLCALAHRTDLVFKLGLVSRLPLSYCQSASPKETHQVSNA